MLRQIYSARNLIWILAQREVQSKFQGSTLGVIWVLLTPLLMLAVYTLVFSTVFKSRWPGINQDGPFAYAIVLFSSLILFQIFSEVIVRAPLLVVSNPNYVTKLVFPLEILPVVALISTVTQATVSLGILLLFHFILMGLPPPTALLVPVAVIPLLMMVLGLSWLLASLGVFLRDLNQLIGWMVTVVMFTSPVFFPMSSVPPVMQKWMLINPLTLPLEWIKSLLFLGTLPEPTAFIIYTAVATLVFNLGYLWFKRTKKAFADVL
jgi:lipopolysaccharide transport system permease protein